MKQYLWLLLFSVSVATTAQDKKNISEINLDSVFHQNIGTFVYYEPEGDHFLVYNLDRATVQYPVHSTSKIVWSIIGLEEHLISDENEAISWDSIKYPKKDWWPESWTKDLGVKTALNQSVNWYYIELLSKMNPELIENWISKLNYGKIPKIEEVHYFGLTMMIRKSAFEQIKFLSRLINKKLNISDQTYNIIKEALYYKTMNNAKIYIKSGLGPDGFDSGIGWIIGFVEKGENVNYFALNVQDDDEWKAAKLRYVYFEKILPVILSK